MKQYMFLAIFLYIFISFAQEGLINTNYQDWELSVFIGSCNSTLYHNVAVTEQQTDTAQVCPIMFQLPDKNDSEVLINAYRYTEQYGNIPYFANYNNSDGLMQTAVKHHFKAMYKRDIKKLDIIKNPDNPTTGQWIIKPTEDGDIWQDFSFEIINKYGYAYWNSINDNSQKRAVMLMLPIFDYNKPHGFVTNSYDVSLPSYFIGIQYRPEALNETNAVICHEIGHLILNYPDIEKYNSYSDTKDGEIISKTYNAAWPYDLMSAIGGGYCSQYQLYGIGPVNTNDLLNTSPDILTAKNIVPNSYSNKTKVRLKSIREPLVSTDTCNVVVLPIESIDFAESTMPTAKKVENQKFIIEYRNGKGYENCSPVDMDGECKGILIQHIIDDKSFGRIIDIECATALPEGARNSEDIPDSLADYRGKWFFGKKINDWMDDIVYNQKDSLKGGNGAWWRATNSAKYQSLPSDFFNDTDRNKFTPSTRPSTRSWKDNETNIAIFIDNIDEENNYADLTIYRNYHSTPLTSANAKSLPDGEKGLTIAGDGYIGENFSVGGGTSLRIGGTSGSDKTTLIPHTNMSVYENGKVYLWEDSKLRLESSILKFIDGAIFHPAEIATIELNNSDLSFDFGSEIRQLDLLSYNFSVTGASSFYNSNFDMIDASVLSVNENSSFTLKEGTNIVMSPLSTFTLKAGSELILEDGVNLVFMNGASVVFETGSKLTVNGTAKINGRIQVSDVTNITIQDESSLILNQCDITIHTATSLNIGISSQLVIENGSSVIFDDGTVAVLSADAEIRVMDGGELITNNNSTEKVTFKNKTGLWYSIIGELGSTIKIDDAEIIGAEIGVCGTPTNCSITNSRFLDCENGISLVNCGDYTISDNAFSGKGIGTGITLTYCSDPIVGNSVSNFAEGVKLVSSSITLVKNIINNNINNGLYVTGHGSKPLLVNADTKDVDPPGLRSFNNEIKDNCLNNPYYNGAQIYLRYSAGVYMTGGCNNVYSGGVGTIPTVPCIKGIINITPDPAINKVTIAAERNYWGYDGLINSLNQGIFFDLPHTKPIEGEIETGYFIDYEPYGKIPFVEGGIYPMSDLSSNEPRSNESILLFNALKLEQLDNLKPSIKLYEQIIKKYPDTPEYFVAITRLPELYVVDERSLDPLISSYEVALETENTSVKKFFKEMKVSTHIKGKNYDKAIELAEEMKAEAEGEEEILLSEIDIAIASMLKESESGSKGRQSNYSDNLKILLSKLNGTESKEEPAVITEEVVLPKENILYQNYPNPFNPVTQIKFDLAKTADVKLTVYNVNGQKIAELANGVLNAGKHSVEFDGSKLNTGIYYYTLNVDGNSVTKKMVLTK